MPLVGATSKNDRFHAMFDEQFPYVWTSLRRLGIATRDLEDITHEVFIQVYRQMDRYDPTRSIKPWLFAFAFRFASDYRRLARHKVELSDESDNVSSPLAGAEELLVQKETRQLVMQALEKIDIDRRAVFILYELDGSPMNEIAVALDVPRNTLYSRLRVAREEFKEAFRRLQTTGGRS